MPGCSFSLAAPNAFLCTLFFVLLSQIHLVSNASTVATPSQIRQFSFGLQSYKFKYAYTHFLTLFAYIAGEWERERQRVVVVDYVDTYTHRVQSTMFLLCEVDGSSSLDIKQVRIDTKTKQHFDNLVYINVY
jgi:hypothetical protein